MYWVADQIDAINAPHMNIIPIWDNRFIVINNLEDIVSGVTIELIANNAKNDKMHTICNVVLILPIEKRA